VSSELQPFLRFFEEQKSRQAPHFPTVRADKVLAFMGTTSLAGSRAAVSVNAVRAIEPGPTPRELRIALAGALPRPPTRGECVTVHVTRLEQYQGYQVKTRALGPGVAEGDLAEPAPGGGLVVKGAQIFTVHHSPYTLKFFESVPYDELKSIVGDVRFALVAVGETANLSPRFVFHHEVEGDRLALYHGDGLALKTYMNVKANRHETRLVLDLDDFSGWLLPGVVEEFQPHQHPEAYERVCAGFSAGSWGMPSRVFRFVPERFERIAPVA
jgi:hypothetical protein